MEGGQRMAISNRVNGMPDAFGILRGQNCSCGIGLKPGYLTGQGAGKSRTLRIARGLLSYETVNAIVICAAGPDEAEKAAFGVFQGLFVRQDHLPIIGLQMNQTDKSLERLDLTILAKIQ